ncbi:glycosyltransferase family 87 protein [Paludisphaera soli]|uniref:glycosyltransferase family 87 protein n=1 Tax=Paludisphaera soli TaxID=2712865 RepID=UPI0013ECCBF0|nr:glycosyltransferase family 87 protein [Paludisphaera soli]
MPEIDTGVKSRVVGRFTQPVFWGVWATVVVIAAAFYYPKAADSRSAFVRWQPQVLKFWDGTNIYDKMYFPNPPIMPITLYPLMTLPPVAAAMGWFLIKAGLTSMTLLICFDAIRVRGKPIPPFFQTAVLLLALRPILGDLHHGNINLLILFFLAAMFHAWRKGYDRSAGLLLGLAIAFKVTPALFLPYFAYKRSWRTVGWTFTGLLLFLLIVPSAVIGPRFNALCLSTWCQRMVTPFLVEGSASPQEANQSMVGVMTRLLTEIEPGTDRYDVQHDLNLAALPPDVVGGLVKAVSFGFIGLLAFFCRTKDADRTSPRYLGEISLVVLTMLFLSERSWKHHFVTMVFPYTFLMAELYSSRTPPRSRWGIFAALTASFLLMASTSSEFGGLFAHGKGHEIAQGYGMFMWAAFVLFVAVAWRLRADDAADGLEATVPAAAASALTAPKLGLSRRNLAAK